MESVSTRLLVATARLIVRGVPPRLACQTAITAPLTDEPDALAALTQVVEISIWGIGIVSDETKNSLRHRARRATHATMTRFLFAELSGNYLFFFASSS